jgi:hypothetical protein
MLRLRIFAGVLSLLAVATGILAIVVGASIGVPVALAFAAACLGSVAPFDATSRWHRTRVVFAGVAFLAGVAVALVLARGETGANPLLLALVGLAQLGVGLTCWAFAIRKRRRMPRSRRYFDN